MKTISLPLLWIILFCTTLLPQEFRSEEDFKNYFVENIGNLEPIEGIWSYSLYLDVYKSNGTYLNSMNKVDAAKFAVIGNEEKYEIYNMSGSKQSYYFTGTSSKYIYFFQQFRKGKKERSTQIIIEDINTFSYTYKIFDETIFSIYKGVFVRTFPSDAQSLSIIKNTPKSATGFLISSDGLIVTNCHVVEGARTISVRGIEGNFSESYSAEVISKDCNNDLAIIKVIDTSFKKSIKIPFVILEKTLDVGKEVFTLSYPLTSTMGEDIKLTNGIISSRSGYKSDITTYQISVPVQPGSSGAPLFDYEGNLIGIINAKHTGAEAASYAIKSAYLINLINELSPKLKLQVKNKIGSKSLSDKVKSIKNFVYIIEINN